jgi:8-oxo-dGTP pyrophosphatase MutT (NUDIX family)
LHPGETHEEAVRREVWEETGLRDVDLGPCVWLRSHVFRWGERLIDQRERYFVARCTQFELDVRNWQPEEMTFLTAHRWWAIEEIGAAPDVFVPRNMGSALRELLAGFPAEPIVMGT